MNGLNSEYEALRKEMDHRVEIIDQASVKGVAAAIAAIGFLSQASPPLPGVAWLIQMFLILWGFYILDQYWILHRIGTYLAFSREGNDPNSSGGTKSLGVRLSSQAHGYQGLGVGVVPLPPLPHCLLRFRQ